MCEGDHEPQQSWNDAVLWHRDDKATPAPQDPHPERLYKPEVLKTIDDTINGLSEELRALSLDIHGHPELLFKEYYAHDTYTAFMRKHGWKVTEHLHLETAWEATFEHGQGGRVIGVNSEMDALPDIGHACGHNLIGIAGVAVSLGLRAALEKHNIPGKIVLLGTPAEEGGDGKAILLKEGAYKGMDACLMCHPAPGPLGSVSLTSCYAREKLIVEYEGHPAHSALSPWEGRNALDAAVLGYVNISALRQQLKPTTRVHGIFEAVDWAVNIVPAKARFICFIRAPTRSELLPTVERVLPCFHGAAQASGCEVKITHLSQSFDIRQNKALGDEVANIMLNKYGSIDYEWGIRYASTDFGNVSYDLPALHPSFSIPTVPNGGNHTHDFAKSAAMIEAHKQCLVMSIALAGAGLRVLTDDAFFTEVKKAFEEDKEIRKFKDA
ncbi:hypothetical protein AGABI2DRAFT_138470 [Agaricus bisporus var. bisporus H97]|uniref:hypothetical protein n=1 Tax=Agaricus bisporus var. bisporus (strain H97 / ATCC MYA-4626 / FGSC 10389) TaxID=936046 RepID=UPI00029F7A54|nr:hypothetical protein AGABI2DRAFT_138470 [Agaricus bisporus var. bisporus H97]EKV43964.1 hypothetical protein AGABI2DRAFT_138470 [Agaricus bisporus var. bisporus H97]